MELLTSDTLALVLVGLVTAGFIVGAARAAGFERDRSFYPTVLVVIAFLYVLFGVQMGRPSVLGLESAVALAFSLVAVLAYRCRLTVLLAAGLVAHGLWDAVHGVVLPASDAVPSWWPAFCLGVDVALGAYVFFRWPFPS